VTQVNQVTQVTQVTQLTQVTELPATQLPSNLLDSTRNSSIADGEVT
jgi:hypothetical protein